MIEEIVESFGGKKPQQTKLRAALEQSSIRDLTEFGRVVHAEMEALLSCARKGVVVKQATMYCTTFPCHNCAKHIIAAGIQRVVFVEPYLKSRAFKLHDDAVSMSYGEASGSPSSPKKVFFEPFVGVGPRPFLDLFSMNLGVGNPIKRKNTDGTVVEWSPEKAEPRITMLAASYRHSEADAARLFKEELKKASAEDGGTPVRA